MAIIDNSHWPLNSILVSQKYRVLYTPIAKNANTTLKRLFVRLSGYRHSDEILGGDVHSYLTSIKTGLSLCDYTPGDAAQILNDPEYFRFVMLRDPLSRAVSGYVDKFVLYPPSQDASGDPPIVTGAAIDWVYQRRDEPPDYDRSITFEEFVDHIFHNDDTKLDTHFKSQESYFEQQSFDFIGVIEKMERLISVLARCFQQSLATDIEHQNRIVRRKPFLRRRGQARLLPAQLRAQRTLPHSSELLTGKIREQLTHRYARDIEMWQESFA